MHYAITVSTYRFNNNCLPTSRQEKLSEVIFCNLRKKPEKVPYTNQDQDSGIRNINEDTLQNK